MKLKTITIIFLLLVWIAACNDEGDALMAGASKDGDYSNSAGDSDTDSDTDTDSDSDSDADGYYQYSDTDEFVPEEEQRFDYRIPVSSGKYVFIADRQNDAVIAVHSETLAIQLIETGSAPSHVVPISDNGEVAVLCVNSDEVDIIRIDKNGTPSTKTLDVRPDTNALKASASGRYIIAFWDGLFENEYAAPATTQDISILDTQNGNETAFHMFVGMDPTEIIFNNDDTRAFAITSQGINVIDLSALGETTGSARVKLFDYTLVDPEDTEILIDPSGTIALGRVDSGTVVTIAWLDGSAKANYDLATVPTDIDIDPAGRYGLITLRGVKSVAKFDLDLEPTNDNPFEIIALGEIALGSAAIAPDGNSVAFYTTADSSTGEATDNQKVLTMMDLTDVANPVLNSERLKRSIDSVVFSPDSTSIVVEHKPLYSTGEGESIYAYSLVLTDDMQYKFQQTNNEPTQYLFSPSADYAYAMLDNVQRIELINLTSLNVDPLELGSIPVAIGHAPQSDRVFISQSHPSGRMTFMDDGGTNISTVTGYTLNN